MLWRTKRMESILSSLWAQGVTGEREIKSIREIEPIFKKIHLLRAEMVHFVSQIQYYIGFEVTSGCIFFLRSLNVCLRVGTRVRVA
jgi:gamma-tubulin complex component 3